MNQDTVRDLLDPHVCWVLIASASNAWLRSSMAKFTGMMSGNGVIPSCTALRWTSWDNLAASQ